MENTINLFYDAELSSFLFNDWIQDLDSYIYKGYSRRGDLDYIVIGGMSQNNYKISHLRKMKKDGIVELTLNSSLGYYGAELDTKENLIADLMTITVEDHYSHLHDKLLHWHDLPYTFKSYGFNQGDIVKVLVLDNLPDELKWLTDEDFIDNLFWKTPVSGYVNFNGVEYHSCDIMPDFYDYNKEEILEYVKKVHGLKMYEYLSENLPNDLDYK